MNKIASSPIKLGTKRCSKRKEKEVHGAWSMNANSDAVFSGTGTGVVPKPTGQMAQNGTHEGRAEASRRRRCRCGGGRPR